MLSPSPPIEAAQIRRLSRRPPAVSRRICIIAGSIALLVTMLLLALPRHAVAQASAQPIRGEANLSVRNGYARLVIRFPEAVDAQVRASAGILIVQFARPVDVAVDRINTGLTDWVGAARRDPDGRALRFALARKVRINTIAAGERLFIDLLPETWTGEPPGLPAELVEDLARRAREAERLVRERLAQQEERKIPPVRVRIASQPTFTRYIFELPELVGVTTARGKDALTLTFAKPLNFDLADAKLASVAAVAKVDAMRAPDTATVSFAFASAVDVRSFREDFNFVVDVTPIDEKAARQPPADMPKIVTAPKIDPPATVPADDTPDKPAAEPQPGPVTPVASPPPVTAPPPSAPRDPKRPVAAELRRNSGTLQLLFPFAAPTPAAAFQRGDVLWLVFDTPAEVGVAALDGEVSRTVRSATVTRAGEAAVVRIRLERPLLNSLVPEGNGWLLTIAETVQDTPHALGIARNLVAPGRSSVTIPFDAPARLHRLNDPELEDTLLVVTGLGPARALVKTQDFIEFRALGSTQGVAIQPFADDLAVDLAADKITVGRPAGLTLSESAPIDRRGQANHAVTFDTQLWKIDRDAKFNDRQQELIRTAAEAPFTRRSAQRLVLARFYLAQQMYAEAKAVLDVAIADDAPSAEDPSPLALRAVANLMLNRTEAALKDLGNPLLGNQNDAPLWRALAYARQGKWAQARDQFRNVESSLTSLPLELQRIALKDAFRAQIEVGDFAAAIARLNDFDTVGVPKELEATVAVLAGRLAERLGRAEDALASYKLAAESADRPAAAQGRLRQAALRYRLGELKKAEIIDELETLTVGWRGDETEIEALQMLARLYTEEDRHRDAFHVMRVALASHPQSMLTRTIQDEAAKTFDSLFLAGKGDALPAIEALSLFYDFRELAPIGRRGDEMIRRLADRLVSVDLLDQAAELLQYQVDNRLQGAARAQVAMRLSVIYLMNRKPDKAQATLRATRTADLSNEVRSQRLLLEARAISDVGRHDLALEIIAQVEGREAIRLRADIHWAARRWQKAAEQIELLYAERAASFEPLTELERSDLLRAGIGYALAEDKIGKTRLREKFSAKMASGPDRRAFEIVTGGLSPNSPEFRAVARVAAAVDTLDGFLRDMRTRYPDMNAGAVLPDPHSTGALTR